MHVSAVGVDADCIDIFAQLIYPSSLDPISKNDQTILMNKIVTLIVAFAALLTSASVFAADEKESGTLYHVVSLKLKDGTSAEQIKAVETAFAGLKDKIPGITSLKWGTNVSPENKNKGFTHCFVLTFASEKDRDAYIVHPDHKAFGGVLKPVVDDVFVIDFWAK